VNNQPKQKPVIGIVGGIGAGKTTVSEEFVRLGCALVDGDAIGHELLREEDVREQLRARWGEGVFAADGGVNRDSVARIVFADPSELRALNEILHPRIRARMEREIQQARADRAFRGVVVDAAVLFEARWDDLCTHTVFVGAPFDQRCGRIQAARGWDDQTLLRREKSQISLDKKAEKCDYSVDNSSSISHLREQVRELFQVILYEADRP
jgi:dephospho-CoA kinase